MFKKLILFSVLLFAIPACSTLPNTGPSVSNVASYEGAKLVEVDAVMARSMRQALLSTEEQLRNDNMVVLTKVTSPVDYVLQPGDKFTMSMTTWTPGVITPTKAESSFIVDASGSVNLPYLKDPVSIAGYSPSQAQSMIAGLYTKRRVFLAPDVQIRIDETDAAHGVLVTGTIGTPKMIPWVPGGMSLASVLTKAMGNSQILGLQQNALNGGTSATSVKIIRHGQPTITIPVDLALENDIPLQQNDKIIVSHKPAVQVTVMGGGINNGLYDFAQHPSLAQAVAQAKGLNPQTANAKAVYVFRNGDNPKLYSFAFKTTDAQFAAQQFPLMDADIVYVAEAGIVPISHIFQAIWPLATMATVIK
jgi:polysaccharide export outer membrane protein